MTIDVVNMNSDANGPKLSEKDNTIERNLLLKDIEDLHQDGYDDVRTINIEKAIEKQDSIDVQILKLVDSEFASLSESNKLNEIIDDTVDFKKLKKIIYIFSGKESSNEERSYKEWEHSYACSVLMKTMIEENDLPVSRNMPMAALFHDIGRIFLKRYRPQKYKMAESYSKAKRTPMHMVESSFLKITHAEISGLLMRKWGMSEDLVLPVLAHHDKEIPENYILETALLKFADWVDYYLRRELCSEPEQHIMSAAGIESIDNDYWMRRHREISCEVHSQYFCDTNTHRLKKAIKKEANNPQPTKIPNRENTLSKNTIL